MALKSKIGAFISHLFGGKPFDRVVVEKPVVDAIVSFARGAYPKEFIALLAGSVRHNALFVDGLLYQTSFTSENSALVQLNLPLLSGCVGSVHSHPSYNNLPSGADLAFFNKQGPVNFIVCLPFSRETLACYGYAHRVNFEVSG